MYIFDYTQRIPPLFEEMTIIMLLIMFVIKFMSLDVEHKHTNKLKKTKNYC